MTLAAPHVRRVQVERPPQNPARTHTPRGRTAKNPSPPKRRMSRAMSVSLRFDKDERLLAVGAYPRFFGNRWERAASESCRLGPVDACRVTASAWALQGARPGYRFHGAAFPLRPLGPGRTQAACVMKGNCS